MAITPTQFLAKSAQGAVILTWNQSVGSTSYKVYRSTDNISFSLLATTSPINYFGAQVIYNDSTGTIGTIYYYYVKANDGVLDSSPTNTLPALPLNPGQTTLANLRLAAQQRSDLLYSSNITTQEWNSYISDSFKWMYNHVLQKFGDDYYIQKPYTYTTTGSIDPTFQAQVFPLPPDFFKLMRVEVALNPNDPNSWITLRKFNSIQANLYNYPNQYTLYGITNLRYRLWGTYLQIVPISTPNQTLRIWYSPRPDELISDTQVIDGYADFEELIVIDVCIKALLKQEQSAMEFEQQKMQILAELEAAAENRDVALPDTISDSRRKNFSWSDGGEDGGFGW